MHARLTAAAIVAVLATALTFGAMRWLGLISPEAGPLHPSAGNRLKTPAKAWSTVAVSFFPRSNPTDDALELRSVRLLRASPGLELVGSGVFAGCRGKRECRALSYRAWPPAGIRLEPVPGYSVRAGSDSKIIVGLKVRHPAKYKIRGIVLTYQQGWRTFEVEVGPNILIDASRKAKR